MAWQKGRTEHLSKISLESVVVINYICSATRIINVSKAIC